MCGIFGYSIPNEVVSRFQRGVLASNLARLNDDRGGHSWGILGLVKNKPQVIRGLGDLAPHVVAMAPFTTLYAHTRWATTGDKTIPNAHPFEFGNIIGAHNGVISNDLELDRKHGRRVAVDSMHIFMHMNEGKDLSEIEGYGAIEWWDATAPDRLWMARVTFSGDLAIHGIGTGPEDVKGVIWSSDEKHLMESCESAGLDTFEYKVETGVPHYVQNYRLWLDEKRSVKISGYSAKRASVYGRWDDSGFDWEDYSSLKRDSGRKQGEPTVRNTGKVLGPVGAERVGASKNSTLKDPMAKYRLNQSDYTDPDNETRIANDADAPSDTPPASVTVEAPDCAGVWEDKNGILWEVEESSLHAHALLYARELGTNRTWVFVGMSFAESYGPFSFLSTEAEGEEARETPAEMVVAQIQSGELDPTDTDAVEAAIAEAAMSEVATPAGPDLVELMNGNSATGE